MKREPARQQQRFDRDERHGPPGHLLEQCQRDAGEHIGAGRPTLGQDGAPSALHVRRFGVVAGQFQRVVHLDRAAQVHGPAVVQVPATIGLLAAAQIDGQLGGEVAVDLAHVMHHQQVFGRDGAVGLELEAPVAVGVLPLDQRADATAERCFHDFLVALRRVAHAELEHFTHVHTVLVDSSGRSSGKRRSTWALANGAPKLPGDEAGGEECRADVDASGTICVNQGIPLKRPYSGRPWQQG